MFDVASNIFKEVNRKLFLFLSIKISLNPEGVHRNQIEQDGHEPTENTSISNLENYRYSVKTVDHIGVESIQTDVTPLVTLVLSGHFFFIFPRDMQLEFTGQLKKKGFRRKP
ncbi:hypothetical protein NQ317_008651 [Molorchus minor]|uniref:Uncharacterized protein n=1 Tax=Molorchus minor TaxID=1323400 RepID=A0ABQ9K269_9CUCU|nr:hypothetical protein NQ317_008651 [Molorchus minor]